MKEKMRVFVQMVNGEYTEVWTTNFATDEVNVLREDEEKKEVAENAFRYGSIVTDTRKEENGVHTRATVFELKN